MRRLLLAVALLCLAGAILWPPDAKIPSVVVQPRADDSISPSRPDNDHAHIRVGGAPDDAASIRGGFGVHVHGVVLDQDGRLMPGLDLVFSCRNEVSDIGTPQSAKTDASGAYGVDLMLFAGTSHVRAYREGRRGRELLGERECDGVTMTRSWVLCVMDDVRMVRGRVTSKVGDPIPQASVSSSRKSVLTDADGRFELDVAFSRGRALLVASADGWCSTSCCVSRPISDDRDVSIHLIPGLTLDGKVLDSQTGLPLVGATIVSIGDRPTRCVADADGCYKLSGLGSEAKVRVALDGYVAQSDVLVLNGNAARDWALDRGFALAGLVRSVGRGVEGALIAVAKPPSVTAIHAPVSTDASGRFNVRGLAPGDYAVSVSIGAYRFTRRCRLENNDHMMEFDVPLRDVEQIRGRVVDSNGQGVAGATVDALVSGDVVLSGLGGDFQIEAVRDEERVMVQAHGFLSETVSAYDRVIVQLRHAGVVRGRVVSDDGIPLDEFVVKLTPPVKRRGDVAADGFGAEWVRPGVSFSGSGGVWSTEGEGLCPGAVIGVTVDAPYHDSAHFERVVVPAPSSGFDLLFVLRRKG